MSDTDSESKVHQLDVSIARTYTWHIENFRKICLDQQSFMLQVLYYDGEKIHDDELDCKHTSSRPWILKLYPNGLDDDSRGYICFEMVINDAHRGSLIQVDCKLSMLRVTNIEGNSRYDSFHLYLDGTEQTSRLFRNFMKLDELLKPENGFLVNNGVTLLFTIGIQSDGEFVSKEELTYKSRLQLSDDFGRFYNSKKFNDITFIVGGKELHANKSILAARSPVFFARFDLDNKDKNKNAVTIDGVKPKVFEEMLMFIYSGDFVQWQRYEHLEDLLVLADKYAIEGLHEMCAESLKKIIRTNNAMQILYIADSHKAHTLKQEALKYIVNHADRIIESDAFENTEPKHFQLMKEMFCALAVKHRGCKQLYVNTEDRVTRI